MNRSHATVVHEVSPYLSPYHPETRLSPEDSVAQPFHEWHVDGWHPED
ncbi:TcmI family type II polyketide cyclase [Geodermatophilus maliterrae]|uniref:TcmI family type II polyketide cyclase n=1 Tax=Geodermatophilus maliterrae TaxID=3162531 RepID=A0ABV3XLA2_9ACTN